MSSTSTLLLLINLRLWRLADAVIQSGLQKRFEVFMNKYILITVDYIRDSQCINSVRKVSVIST